MPTAPITYDFAEVCADAILREKTARMARDEAMLRSDLVRIIREQDAIRPDRPASDQPMIVAPGKPLVDVLSGPERIYEAYPRHVGRKAALAAIKRSLQAHAAAGDASDRPQDFVPELLAKVQAYAAAVAKWPANERRFIPHPATWFNQGRYSDDPREWARGSARDNSERTYEKV